MKYGAPVLFTFAICCWWFLLGKPSGKRLSTATCTLLFSWSKACPGAVLVPYPPGPIYFLVLCRLSGQCSTEALLNCATETYLDSIHVWTVPPFLVCWNSWLCVRKGQNSRKFVLKKRRYDLRQQRKAVLMCLLFHWLLPAVTRFAQLHVTKFH